MKKRTTRRVTQADIARRLDIHQTTVSAVLRGDARIYVAAATRRRILETALRAGYPLRRTGEEAAARQRRKNTGVIGVLNFSTPTGAGAERLRQTLIAVTEAGFRPLVADAGWAADGGAFACDTLIQSGAEAVVLCGLNDFFDLRLITAFHKHRMPVAAISAAIVPGALTLASDREEGFERLVAHLTATGRRRLWLSTFAKTRAGAIPSHDLQLAISRGFDKAVRAEKLTRRCRVVRSRDRPGAGYSHHEFGHRAMRRLLRETAGKPLPDAVLCFGDSWALGAARACAEAGVRIPEDIALTGYGGEPFTAFMNPPLTTIATPFDVLAGMAVEAIRGALDTRTRSLRGSRLVPGNLFVRQSTASKCHS